MAEFSKDAEKLLELIGGKENVVSFTHCATRMRFVLADEKKADVKKIEELPSVKGSFTQGGQFQVIIGNKVSVFFDEFSRISRMDGVDKQEVKAAAKGKMNLLQRGVANLAEIFAPIIPAIIVGGLILGFRNIIGDIKLLEDGTKSITEVYQMWAGNLQFPVADRRGHIRIPAGGYHMVRMQEDECGPDAGDRAWYHTRLPAADVGKRLHRCCGSRRSGENMGLRRIPH